MAQTQSSNQPQRHSFDRRAWTWIGLAFVAAVLLQMPAVIHDRIMQRRVRALESEANSTLAQPADRGAWHSWLRNNGFQVTLSDNNQIIAERVLSRSNLFWRPATAQVWITLENDRHESVQWLGLPIDRSGTGSRFDGQLPGLLGCAALPLVAIVVMILSARRETRLYTGRCAECGYPIGASDLCTECGAAIARMPGVKSEAMRAEEDRRREGKP